MKVSSAHQPGKRILGLISYSTERADRPGWIVQYFESGRLFAVDLGVESEEAVMAAIADAAEFLDCRPENIQVGNEPLTDTESELSSRSVPVRLDRVRGATEARARVYYAVEDVLRPGWYVQFYAEGRLDRLPLWQNQIDDEEAARTEAAWMLGCRPEEIQVGGELFEWPKKGR